MSDSNTRQATSNPLNLCSHGMPDGSGDCDECRFEYEAYEAHVDEQVRAFEESQRCPLCRGFVPEECDGLHRDDPHADELFFEVAL